MLTDDALLEACRWSPDDDAPRLVWADAVGGERGELVVIQCDLARGGLPPAEAAARRRRERELLAVHGAAWAGLGELGLGSCRFEFRRGFVEAVALDARAFVEDGEEIFRRAPLLRSLGAGLKVTSGDPLDALQRLIASPSFWRLEAIDLAWVGVQTQAFDYDPGFDGHGDEAARLLAGSGALAHLSGLGVTSSGLTAAGVHHLVASGELAHLERLWLRGHDLGGDAILAVLPRAPRLASLDLAGATDLEAFVPALPPVAELHLSGITDRTLAALGRSGAAATVEALRLSIGELARGDGFRAFPRLRALDLHAIQLATPELWVRELAAAAPPSLRRLRLPWIAPAGALRVVARELGPRLEALDLSGTTGWDPEILVELQGQVAGEVIADEEDGQLELL